MESCPRFEYLFLATYSSRPTTRPFLGPAVYAPTREPPHLSPVPRTSALQASLRSRPSDPLSGAFRLEYINILSSPLSFLLSKDKPAAICFSLPTSPHKPTKHLVNWFCCDLAPLANATLKKHSSSLVVRLPCIFPPLLPRKQLKRFRISLHNGSHQQSKTNFYWSLGGRSTRKPRKRLRPSRHRHPRTTPGPTGSQLPPIPTFSTSLPRPTVEFGIQPPRKYLKKIKKNWN